MLATTMTTGADDALGEALRLAVEHQQAGRLSEAEAQYRRVLGLDANHVDALYGLGTLALGAGRHLEAQDLIRRAMQLRGEWPEAWYHLGLALAGGGQLDEAIIAQRRAVALDPALFESHYNLAICLQLSGQRDKAIGAYRQAIALRGGDPCALVNFATALRGAGRLDEAIATLRGAVAVKPDFAEAWSQLGIALREAEMPEEAMAALGRACDLAPGDANHWIQLAGACWDAAQIDQALRAQRLAATLRPDDPDVNCTLGQLLLLAGDHVEGLRRLEWRWKRKSLPWPRRRFSQLMWDGGDLAGRTIYLNAEQSIGDTIQFARFIPLVAGRNGKIIVECQPSLRRLFQGSFGQVQRWFCPGDAPGDFDVYCPMMSLPLVLGVWPQSAGGEKPHLHADAASVQIWRQKLARCTGTMKVGLAWAGSPSQWQDRRRSMHLRQLRPLAEITGVQFFSLQKGWSAAQAGDPDVGITLVDFGPELGDFADTAALISELDLIITVDTAVAHLAGALGKPVWTLLPLVPHWRWTLKGGETLWYPSMRLFRQTTRGDWDEVIRRVADRWRQFRVHPSP
jgi:tetratricopeptide (TPR) repeat protein